MRIIAGDLRGRRLEIPKDAPLRPTTDRVREAVFSSLQSLADLSAGPVIDLYAGSGALGIEALSRGAPSALFIERNKRLAQILRQNLEALELTGRAEVFVGAVEQAVPKLPALVGALLPDWEARPRVIFIDPPYAEHPGPGLVLRLAEVGMVAPGTSLVIESGTDDDFEGLASSLEDRGLSIRELRSKKYGDTRVRYYCF